VCDSISAARRYRMGLRAWLQLKHPNTVLSLVWLKRLTSCLTPADRRLIFGLIPCFTCNMLENRRLTGLDRRLTPSLHPLKTALLEY
jgi:hypothetical protein